MKIDELEDLLSSIDNSVLDEYYHLFWGSKDYNRLKRIAGKLKYKGVADMFKLNLRGAYETHLDPRKFEETHFIKRFKILLQEVENADPFNWTPFMNYFYIRLNLKYCKRALSKSFSEILIEQKNQ